MLLHLSMPARKYYARNRRIVGDIRSVGRWLRRVAHLLLRGDQINIVIRQKDDAIRDRYRRRKPKVFQYEVQFYLAPSAATPRGRCRPSGFGMFTLLDGCAR